MYDIDITFERDQETSREPTVLAAQHYNNLHTLLAYSERGYVFVPLRGMQYIAVIDREEVIFSDSNGPRIIQIAWQNFKPQQRMCLTDSVMYEQVLYDNFDVDTLRLHSEFNKSVGVLLGRQRPKNANHVVVGFEPNKQ
jgi:hypothetical protein